MQMTKRSTNSVFVFSIMNFDLFALNLAEPRGASMISDFHVCIQQSPKSLYWPIMLQECVYLLLMCASNCIDPFMTLPQASHLKIFCFSSKPQRLSGEAGSGLCDGSSPLSNASTTFTAGSKAVSFHL